MYSRWQLTTRYLKYYFTAANGKGHGTHSPFVYSFITRVLNDKTKYEEYEQAEQLRQRLLKDQRIIMVEDFGAGSAMSKSNRRSIASIAANAAKPKKFGQLLFRSVRHYRPSVILELGTSLGITTSYLSMANPGARLLTLEGASSIASVARNNFEQLQLSNAELLEGNFDQALPDALQKLGKIDFAFIDGNHRQEPTERYFSQLLPCAHNDTILVFDDIHWSREMEAAWKSVCGHPAVRCSIDLFFIGLVFFRQEFAEKQHFTIRY